MKGSDDVEAAGKGTQAEPCLSIVFSTTLIPNQYFGRRAAHKVEGYNVAIVANLKRNYTLYTIARVEQGHESTLVNCFMSARQPQKTIYVPRWTF